MAPRYQWKRESETGVVTPILSFKILNKNKNKKTIFSIGLFITLIQFGVLCVFSTGFNTSDENKQTTVAVAAKTFRKGTILNENMIEMKPKLVGDLKDYLLSESVVREFIGLSLSQEIKEGEPFFKNNFYLKAQKTFPESIPLGKRLFVLNVDLAGVLQNIQIGDRVDVVAHMDIPSFGKATEVVLDGVRVVGVGRQTNKSDLSKSDSQLSFFVSPEEVKILSFMKAYAVFSIVLRNPEDGSRQSGEAMTFNKFIQNNKIRKIIENDSFKILQGVRSNVAGYK